MPPSKRPPLERLTTFFENSSDRKHAPLRSVEGYFDKFISFMVYVSIAIISLNIAYNFEFFRMNSFIYFIFSVENVYKHFWSTRRFR